METLHGTIRDYAWGSRRVLAEFQGRPAPTEGPEAELWLGAHPGAPARVDRPAGRTLLPDLLAAEPEHWLGAEVVARFGPRLPFLLKVLAPERPLSLQAHPDAEQARAGYAAEEAAGVHRNYVDPYHKPEMLVALHPFEALCGFRDPAVSAAAIAGLGLAELEPVVAALRRGVEGLGEAVRLLLTVPTHRRAGLVEAAVRAAGTAEPAASAAAGIAAPAPAAPAAGIAAPAAAGPAAAAHGSGSAGLVPRLARDYPGDPGVLVALLLNHVALEPGQAIWMPAGNLHAYLRGCGVEIMAASDNVLRGGLTPKRVDVPELLRVLRFEVLADPVLLPVPVAPGVVTWPVPVPDFALYRVRVDGSAPVRLTGSGPRVVLGTAGTVTAGDDDGALAVPRGTAAVGRAGAGALVLTGVGEAYVATVG
ncbi:mannose-6-phosphate isomerase, class I [Plantactinospora sp. KBS50]|uniref:mannose-6-phosphate isomerase, class I n=1 Tax=Plantactinospora sp. KBS50 TaxID=2024580 RepID=UPI000BAABCF2|nr:mannose-6-phosphate isomerase, class I [Plantactinospora sp. KBS50]ASW53729.1 mannose-6-phosphate isomerase, class I [Plantactinospora sp. KBS50]